MLVLGLLPIQIISATAGSCDTAYNALVSARLKGVSEQAAQAALDQCIRNGGTVGSTSSATQPGAWPRVTTYPCVEAAQRHRENISFFSWHYATAMEQANLYCAGIAELKDKQEADAKAAAELKAKQEADAKAAAELKAKQEADAKAAAELKAKQEADAKAAAELKAKQEAETKATAEKIISDAKAEAARILVVAKAKAAAAKPAANKKTTITCVKGKLTKKVTAVEPKCPTGYKVKK